MNPVTDNIFSVGVSHADRPMFDELVPLSQGTSYNSYLVKGSEKTALIETSYPPKADEYMANLEGVEKIDYIVANHGEQDHSGLLPRVMAKFPEARLLTNEKCKQTICDAMQIDESRIDIVNDSTEIALGGRTLKFILAPWVHWPDTMFTWIPEDKIIFTCDFLGAHTSYGETFAREDVASYMAAKRYYAEIMMPFRTFCAKYVKKIRDLNPVMICPSHGGVYKNPEFILQAYENWTSEKPERKVVIPYVSMYGNSYEMALHLKAKLEEYDIETVMCSMIQDGVGLYADEIVDAAVIVYAAALVLTEPHPAIANTAYITNILKPKAKYYALLGSFGWAGKLAERFAEFFRLYKPKNLGSVIAKGKAGADAFAQIDALAKTISDTLSSDGV